jgi:hypothetical protein
MILRRARLQSRSPVWRLCIGANNQSIQLNISFRTGARHSPATAHAATQTANRIEEIRAIEKVERRVKQKVNWQGKESKRPDTRSEKMKRMRFRNLPRLLIPQGCLAQHGRYEHCKRRCKAKKNTRRKRTCRTELEVAIVIAPPNMKMTAAGG